MRYYLIDAFADRPFAGNPAVVCLLDRPLSDAAMAALAREMNLSETAFVTIESETGTGALAPRRLRWFTPAMEIRLCGHATLATARALREAGVALGDELRFATLSGELAARFDGDWIELDFPALPATSFEAPKKILSALGLPKPPEWSGVNAHRNWLLDLGSAAAVRALEPDMQKTMELDCHGVIVTGRGDGDYDFSSRFFAPEAGVFEDPVTGSAHVALAPYWAQKLGKEGFLARQASARGGTLRVRMAGDRVRMAGKSVVVAQGRFETAALG
jgi:PhzF family phenazine biosynthesis protein